MEGDHVGGRGAGGSDSGAAEGLRSGSPEARFVVWFRFVVWSGCPDSRLGFTGRADLAFIPY
ncbi:hypothetical protein GCM10010306_035530 [Streptomyces umbrinus]|nr:hypothetical protein GCM10010306_035530 [Streptomyces umbrinus]